MREITVGEAMLHGMRVRVGRRRCNRLREAGKLRSEPERHRLLVPRIWVAGLEAVAKYRRPSRTSSTS